MIVVQRGVVDITPEYNRALRPVFCVSEGDKTSRRIVITVMQNGEAFLIPSGSTVYIIGKKSDSNIFTYRCSYSGSDVTFDITEQMCAASGIVLCELQINLSGQVLGSANFVYWTEPTPIENGTYSESDLNIMLEAIAGAERLDNFYAGIEDMVAQAVEQIQIMPGQVVIDPTLLINGAAADAAATGNVVRSFLEALVTETTPSAAIATCDDAAGGLPLKKLTANIEPAQSGEGDPSPDNVRPISGYTGVTVTRTGKNLFDINAFNATGKSEKQRCTLAIADDGVTTVTCTTAGVAWIGCAVTVGGSIGNYYTVNIGYGATIICDEAYIIYEVGADGTVLSVTGAIAGGTAYTIRDTACVKIGFRFTFGQMTVGQTVKFYPMLRLASETDSTYEAYKGATYAVNFPTAAGTVYGGTLTINSDGSGTLTVDMAAVDLGTLNWSYKTQGYFDGYTVGITTTIKRPESGGTLVGLLSSQYVETTSNQIYNATQDNAIAVRNTNGDIWVRDTAKGTDAAAFKTAMNGIQLVYPLATPTTYALSAVEVVQMLAGVNNVWLDAAGTVTGEYYASTALYVQKIVNAQKGMIAGVEAEMTASKNYSVGDLMIVGDALYKATAAISSGAALVIGTNIAQTTVAEQLIALANA